MESEERKKVKPEQLVGVVKWHPSLGVRSLCSQLGDWKRGLESRGLIKNRGVATTCAAFIE